MGMLQERWLDPMAPYCPGGADSAPHESVLPKASPASSPGLRHRPGPTTALPPASPQAQQLVGTPTASPPESPGGGTPKRFLAFSTGPRQVHHHHRAGPGIFGLAKAVHARALVCLA